MPTTPLFDQNDQPVFEEAIQAILEGLDGNGVRSASALEVTDGTNDLEIDIATGTARYDGTDATNGSVTTKTLSAGDADPRWDAVVYDVAAGAVEVNEGTPGTAPTPPPDDLGAGQILLAHIYVAAGATDIGSGDILDRRVIHAQAGSVYYADGPSVYTADTVDGALDELQEAAQVGSYPLALASDTDLDVAGTDLTDSAAGITLYDSSADALTMDVLDNAVKNPGTTTANNPGFGTWTQVSATRPAWVELEVAPETDGTSDGVIDVEVDESGGTTADYSFTARALGSGAAGDAPEEVMKVYLPPGAQYRIVNTADPNAGNAINVVREVLA